MVKKYVWKSDLFNTNECLTLKTGLHHFIRSTLTGLADGEAVCVRYDIQTDLDWNMQWFHLKCEGNQTLDIFLRKNASDEWFDTEGNPLAQLRGCTEVDISLTPFTNTLPINRLPPDIGRSVTIEVVYFDLPASSFTTEKQVYTRKQKNLYGYESLDTGFTADLEVDDEGFVVRYAQIWQRVFPLLK